jgi:hypothetical protein
MAAKSVTLEEYKAQPEENVMKRLLELNQIISNPSRDDDAADTAA